MNTSNTKKVDSEGQDLVQAFPFLTQDPALKDMIFDKSHQRSLAAGSPLFQPGGSCEVLAFVLQGSVRVYMSSDTGRELTLYRIERGQTCILSTSSILGQSPFPAFATVEEDTQAVLVPAKLVLDWMSKSAAWRQFLFGLLNTRMGSILLTLEEILFDRLDLRLVRLLVEVADQNLVKKTHQELAAELGSSREVVSRLLRDLEGKGWIQRHRNGILIVDAKALLDM